MEAPPSENQPEHKKTIETVVRASESFDDLYEAIRAAGEGVQGTQKFYTIADLIRVIERVRHGHRHINFVTRTHGIREKVEELLLNDKVYQKYVLRKKR